MNRNRVMLICEKVVYILLCILIIDCCIFGAGRVVLIGGIGFRMMLMGVLCVVSIPLCLKRFKGIFTNKFVLILSEFALWLVISLAMGIKATHRQELIISDIKGFAFFIILPIMLATLLDEKQFERITKCAMYASTALSIFSICMIGVYNILPELFAKIYSFGIERNFAGMSAVTTSLVRLFFHSSMYCVCGCTFSVYYQLQQKKLDFKYILICALNLTAILLTYTRSIYLGIGGAALFLLCMLFIYEHSKGKVLLAKHLLFSVTLFVSIMLVINVSTNERYLQYAFERTLSFLADEDEPQNSNQENGNGQNIEIGDSTEHYQELTAISDNLRRDTLNELKEKIAASPIIGNGLGMELVCRPKGYNEFFFLDLWAKCGMVGLVIYISPLVLMIIQMIRKVKNEDENVPLFICCLSALVGFFIFSFFNPYMNASLGVIYYSFCMTLFSNHRHDDILKED